MDLYIGVLLGIVVAAIIYFLYKRYLTFRG